MSRNAIDVNKLLNNNFQKAATEVKLLSKLDNTILLELYSYYKQATIGDNTTSKPSFLDFKGQAKWSVWNECKGMKRETAQVKYIKLVSKLINEK